MIIKEEPIDSSNFIKRSYYCDICKTELKYSITTLPTYPAIPAIKILKCPNCIVKQNIEYQNII